MFYERLEDGKVHCYLCAHQCLISLSEFGICGVRQNIDGTLYTLVYGEVIAANTDPIEKKPLYHFLPGSLAYSIATIGCNFKCGFCQNWQISQVSKRDYVPSGGERISPSRIVAAAKSQDCLSIAYTYTEPTIFFEYAFDTAKLAKQAGLKNIFVTNGYMSRQAQDTIAPYLDAANIDLKSFREEYYKKICKGRLEPVKEMIRHMKDLGIWVEVTTLLVTGENDSEDELRAIAHFIAGIDKNIPWHISRFHPDYKFTSYSQTPIKVLEKAQAIGKDCGLRYIYPGNVSRQTNTYCYNCNKLLLRRVYFDLEENNLVNGRCPECASAIVGVWK